jgi:hypothetical protein
MLKQRQIAGLALISFSCLASSTGPAISQQQMPMQQQMPVQQQMQMQQQMPVPGGQQFGGQGPANFQQMDQMLNAVESSGFPPPSQPPNQMQTQSTDSGQGQAPFANTGMNQGSLLRQFFGGQQQQQQPPAQQNAQSPLGTAFKTFFSDDSNGSSNANRAEEQASYAHNAYLRSFHGDRDSRYSAAEEAEYAAEQARHEADAAYAKISAGDPNARSYANSARAYANRAQADAERARGNADSAWH